MGLPVCPQRLKEGTGQRPASLLVALADNAHHHALGVNGAARRQPDRLADAQAARIHERKGKAISLLADYTHQPDKIAMGNKHRQALAPRGAKFFLENNGQSHRSVCV